MLPDELYGKALGKLDKNANWKIPVGSMRGGNDDVFIKIFRKTIDNFLQKISRLYELCADLVRIGNYIQRWCRWRDGGIGDERRDLPSLDNVGRDKEINLSPFSLSKFGSR